MLAQWAREHGIELRICSQASRRTMRSSNASTARCVPRRWTRYVFNRMGEVRRIVEDWRHRCNHTHPARSAVFPRRVCYGIFNPILYF